MRIMAPLVVGLGLALSVTTQAAADPTHFLQDGNGYWWDFNADGSVDDGRGPAQDPDSVDAFDSAMRLAVYTGTFSEYEHKFPDVPTQTLELGGRMLVSGPATLCGLNVTRRAYVPDAPGEGWACFLEYLENPTAESIVVTVRMFGNVGADHDTTVTDSSDAPATDFTPADRWMTISDDPVGHDPRLNFNFWGVGTSVVPTAVDFPASQENYYVEIPGVTVPANSTVILMHFCSQSADDTAASANAEYLDGLPAAALVGLNANFGPVINWDVPPDALDVTPSDTFVSSGLHQGPFSPSTRQYTVANIGSGPIDWSASPSEAWITVNPNGGNNFDPSDPDVEVDISINAAANGLDPGMHLAEVTFTNDTSGAGFVRNVQLTINERLQITEAEGFTTEGFQGGPFDPADTTYTMNNGGATPLEWSVTGPAWLDITPNTGTLTPSPMAVVTVGSNTATSALAPGTYTDVLTFNNLTFSTTQTRNAEVVVNERLGVEPTNIFVSRGLQGGPFAPSANTYTLTNLSSDQSIDWSIPVLTTPGWITVTPNTGTLAPDASIQVSAEVNVTAQGMALGDYPDTITFQNDSYGSAMDRDVLLRVKEVVYVDLTVAGGDGLSWATAFDSIQDGIALADATDSWVWVADGEYFENIAVADGVEVYGGFAGGETTMAERDPEANVTIINGAGAGTVVAMGATRCGIDGFTITGGYAYAGGGVLCDGSDDTTFIHSCFIRGNSSDHKGAGIYCLGGAAPIISNCIIVGNTILDAPGRDFGGGICCYQANPQIIDNLICGNHAHHGGGIGCIQASPRIANCVISGNTATYFDSGAGGGGVFAHDKSSPTVVNCIISGNYTQDWSGGGMYCQTESNATLTNCTISSNRSYHRDGYELASGLVTGVGSNPVVTNCVFEGMTNTAIYEGGPYREYPGCQVTAANCLFYNNAYGDFRDYDPGSGTGANYTGGDEINANVDGAHDNVAGSPPPQFVMGASGQWTAPPTYNAATDLSTLTTGGNPFTLGALEGMLINADISQNRHAFIMENTANTVSVVGDITPSKDALGYADMGDTFLILDFHLNGESPCVNVGDNDAPEIGATDLDGAARVVDGVVDLGAYECAAPVVATVLDISPIGGTVSNEDIACFAVTFSRGVTNLDATDFVLTGQDGQTGATIYSVTDTGNAYIWNVCVDTDDAGNGLLGLDLVDVDGSIVDIIGKTPIAYYTSGIDLYIDYLEITLQPQGADKKTGQSHTFSVAAANGAGELHYYWMKDAGAVPGAPAGPVFTISSLVVGDSGAYTCEVSDDYTSITSQGAVLQVTVGLPAAGMLGLGFMCGVLAIVGATVVRKRR